MKQLLILIGGAPAFVQAATAQPAYKQAPPGLDLKVWKNGWYMFSQFLFKPVDVPAFTRYSTP